MFRYDYVVAVDGSGDFLTVQEAVDMALGPWWRRLLHRFFGARIHLLPGVHVAGLVAPACCFGWFPVRLHIFG